LTAIGGDFIGLFGVMLLIETFSSNQHDKLVEATMTGTLSELKSCSTWNVHDRENIPLGVTASVRDRPS
jgi:hypothetical protein